MGNGEVPFENFHFPEKQYVNVNEPVIVFPPDPFSSHFKLNSMDPVQDGMGIQGSQNGNTLIEKLEIRFHSPWFRLINGGSSKDFPYVPLQFQTGSFQIAGPVSQVASQQ